MREEAAGCDEDAPDSDAANAAALTDGHMKEYASDQYLIVDKKEYIYILSLISKKISLINYL